MSRQTVEQAATTSFATLNMHGPALAQVQAERLAADARARRKAVVPEASQEGDGSEESRFFQAYEAARAAKARFSSRTELKLQLIDIAVTLAYSRRGSELVSAATHLLAILGEDPLAQKELVRLATADALRPETIDCAAMLANVVANLIGVCSRVRESTSGKTDYQLDVYLLTMRLVSDLRLALRPVFEAVHAPEQQRLRGRYADGHA
eukprot:CAMPEP_0206050096 /NCGR_PEP_ID=MMETSP1466-20131121/28367_1 /ASSEMBLY_ACC=CAM_ASM_001126 /TAXON_ID=44452 /ORGANISM="Pavlova gyrans, Strain CCMP608" /LENGTH=207 /DNA_ID=CAMNT_0053425203 /DNA_START=9 /DNA_END=628 /DNA_ORIENTATION=-